MREDENDFTVDLVAESKGSGNNLRDDECAKINCGKAHFAALNLPFGGAITLNEVLSIKASGGLTRWFNPLGTAFYYVFLKLAKIFPRGGIDSQLKRHFSARNCVVSQWVAHILTNTALPPAVLGRSSQKSRVIPSREERDRQCKVSHENTGFTAAKFHLPHGHAPTTTPRPFWLSGRTLCPPFSRRRWPVWGWPDHCSPHGPGPS
jgi:hypothetical protein